MLHFVSLKCLRQAMLADKLISCYAFLSYELKSHQLNYKLSCIPAVKIIALLEPKLSDFLLDLHQSLAHQELAKSLDISIGMPPIFANLAASGPWHISSQKNRST